jgi:hypothetical protein
MKSLPTFYYYDELLFFISQIWPSSLDKKEDFYGRSGYEACQAVWGLSRLN